MDRTELKSTGILDREGTEVRDGDTFEYENLYIVLFDESESKFKIYEYQNLLEYGTEDLFKEPYYLLIDIHELEELDLKNDQVQDNIYLNQELGKYLHKN